MSLYKSFAEIKCLKRSLTQKALVTCSKPSSTDVSVSEAKIVKLQTLSNNRCKAVNNSSPKSESVRKNQSSPISGASILGELSSIQNNDSTLLDRYLDEMSADSSFTMLTAMSLSQTIDDSSSTLEEDDDFTAPTQLYVVRSYRGNLVYGDLAVSQGEVVSLICESEDYYFVENKTGKQGFVPLEICVDLVEVYQRVKFRNMNTTTRVTSL